MQQNNILLEQNALIYEIAIKTVNFCGFIPLWSYGESTRAYRMESIGPTPGKHVHYNDTSCIPLQGWKGLNG